MGWGLFAMQPAAVGDELLPFVGILYSRSEYRSLCTSNPRFKRYVLQVQKNVYQDGDVVHGNVAGFINSSKGRHDIGNCIWEYIDLPRPWSKQEWGYTMTVATRDIAVGEELYTFYHVNQ